MLITIRGNSPRIADDAFIAPTAILSGDVEVEAGAGVWFGAALRGDFCKIRIGAESSIQDNCVVHGDPGTVVEVGRSVTVGHGAVLHGCKVHDGALIGMGSIILDGAEVGEDAVVAAGCLVPMGMKIPPRHLAVGVPAQVKREISQEMLEHVRRNAGLYTELAAEYRKVASPR